MPCDYSKYPTNWKAIRAWIRKRARDRCELCGLKRGALGVRDRFGLFHEADPACLPEVSANQKLVKIVLTVAHLNHDVKDNREENLALLCCQCHNRHDRLHRGRNAFRTRNAKKHQLLLFDEEGNHACL